MADITLPVITCPHDIQLITAETQPEELRVCRLYVLIEPTPRGWIVRYIGKTVQPLASRCAQHRRRARTDHLCAPLYRYAAALEHGDFLDSGIVSRNRKVSSTNPPVLRGYHVLRNYLKNKAFCAIQVYANVLATHYTTIKSHGHALC